MTAGRVVRRLLAAAGLGGGLILAGLNVPGAGVASATGSAVNPNAAFLTFLFGRGQYETASSCNPLVPFPDAKNLADVKALFAPKGWIASPNVIVNYAAKGACAPGREDYATWAQLGSLAQGPAGWVPDTAGIHYLRFADLTASEVQAESCGALPDLSAQGFTGAWGLFAFPGGGYLYNSGGGPSTGNAMADIVQHCFAFGRTYGNGVNVRSSMRAPWLVKSLSPVGGTTAGSGGTYEVPSQIINRFKTSIGPGRWIIVQFYRFRSGYVAGDHNCLGPEDTHFTKYNEEYCWEDFQSIVNAVPSSAVVTSPAAVACAWGRLPDSGNHPGC